VGLLDGFHLGELCLPPTLFGKPDANLKAIVSRAGRGDYSTTD
jgi:hypothetical protein